jgi:hypothetical protein
MNSSILLFGYLTNSGFDIPESRNVVEHYLQNWGINASDFITPRLEKFDVKNLGDAFDVRNIILRSGRFDFSILYEEADFVNPYFQPVSLADLFLSVNRTNPENKYRRATGRVDFFEEIAFVPLVTHAEFLGKPVNHFWLTPGLCSLRAAIIRCYLDCSIYGDIRLLWTKVQNTDHLSFCRNNDFEGVGHIWSSFSTTKLKTAAGRTVSPGCVKPTLRNSGDAALYWKDFQHSIESDRHAVTLAIHLTLAESLFPVELDSGKFMKGRCNNYQWKQAQTIICHLYRSQFFRYPNLNFTRRYVPLANTLLPKFRSYLVNLNKDYSFFSNKPQLCLKSSHEKKIPKTQSVMQDYIEEETIPATLYPEELAVLKDIVTADKYVRNQMLEHKYEGLESMYELEKLERQAAQSEDSVNPNKLKKLRNKVKNDRALKKKSKKPPSKKGEDSKTLEQYLRELNDGDIYLSYWYEKDDTLDQFVKKLKADFGTLPDEYQEQFEMFDSVKDTPRFSNLAILAEGVDKQCETWRQNHPVASAIDSLPKDKIEMLDKVASRLDSDWLTVAKHVESEKWLMENPEVWHEAKDFKRAVQKQQRVEQVTYEVKVIRTYETKHIVPLGTSLYRRVDLEHIAREQETVRHRCTPAVRHMKQTLIRAKQKKYHCVKKKTVPKCAHEPIVFDYEDEEDAFEVGATFAPTFQDFYNAYRFQRDYHNKYGRYYVKSLSKEEEPFPAVYSKSLAPKIRNWRVHRRKHYTVFDKIEDTVQKYRNWIAAIPDFESEDVPNHMFEMFNEYKESVVLKKVAWSSTKCEGRSRRVAKSPKDKVYKTLYLQRRNELVS